MPNVQIVEFRIVLPMPTMLPFELMLMWIATAAADTIAVTKIAVLAPRDTGNPDSDTVGYEGILTEGTITLCR